MRDRSTPLPIHDWTRVTAGTFHAFHLAWIAELQRTLNGGALSNGHYALAEQISDRPPPDRRLAIRHTTGDQIVAFIEIVSPGNVESRLAAEGFLDKAAEALRQGAHMLILELIPPTAIAPTGLCGLAFEWAIGRPYDPPPDRPLTLAAFAAGETVTAYVEPTAVGRPLVAMPLFLSSDHYVDVPLEATYSAAYATMPRRWRNVIERWPD